LQPKLHQLRPDSANAQPNRFFPLVSADIILPNLPVRALKTDFRILTELARHDQAKQFGLSQRALKACDDIMNRFRRVKGDTENNFKGVDKMIEELREISWSVLGRLDEEGLRGTCIWDKGEREARVWAIGHWYVRPLGRLISLACLGVKGDRSTVWG
jgi:alpha-mannosidase